MIVYHNAYFLQLCADEEPYLLFASLLGISRADLDGRNNRTIINKTAVGLDYDYQWVQNYLLLLVSVCAMLHAVAIY